MRRWEKRYKKAANTVKKPIIKILLAISILLLTVTPALATDYNMGVASVLVHTNATGHFQSNSYMLIDNSSYSTNSHITQIQTSGYLGAGATWGIGWELFDSNGQITGIATQSMGSADPNTTISAAQYSPEAFLYVDNAGADTYIYVSEFEGYNSANQFNRALYTTPSDYSSPGTGGGSPGVSIVTGPTGDITINFPPPPPPPPVVQPPALPPQPGLSSTPPQFYQPPAYQPQPSNPQQIDIPTYSKPPAVVSPGPLPPAPSLDSSLPVHDQATTADTATAMDTPQLQDTPQSKDPATTRDTATAPDSPLATDQPTAPDIMPLDPVLQRDPPLIPDPPLTGG